ncbi:MAG: sigma 54-interacting transcriptional regulator [Deltaproteobacteria bacterium]|nr:sigma 54-interacting transcriptional regulator [Deltaproteobacteria bacterium]MBW2563001.1 sigma 54-interacting transcriptional regulator [Deltaproteobacteria bacterium]
MKNNVFPFQLNENDSSAIAMFNNGGITYANTAFEKLYNPLKKGDKKKIGQLLSRFNSELLQSGRKVIQKHIQLIPNYKKTEIIVYLLNKYGSRENSLLLVVAQKESVGDLPYFNPGRRVDFDNSPKVELSPTFSQLIGEDIHFKAVLFKAQKAAQSDYPILIKGESGTGKEILATMIHKASRRRNKKFVDINCAAIPDQLIDSELFGYEKGAFTGALPGGRHGLFVEANHGTLFLDEIADASLPTQAKLLRVLNEGYFKRVGSMKNIEVDVRIISATNKDLLQRIKNNHFRQDLIYRLNTITINLPPLRKRPGDIPLLSNFFLEKHSRKREQNLKFSANSLEGLKSYHWPGNVRELKGVIDYMVTMSAGSTITQNHFPDFLLPAKEVRNKNTESRYFHLKDDNDSNLLSKAVQHAEKQIIRDVLQRAKNKSIAIKILGTSRRTFYSKLKQYNMK